MGSHRPAVARHEQRGHDHAIGCVGGMLRHQRQIVDQTLKSNPRWETERARLTQLLWVYDGLVKQSSAEFGTDPAHYELEVDD